MADDTEQLAIEVLARIGDLEANMKKANALTAKAFTDMKKQSASATRQMQSDMMRSTARINEVVAMTDTKIGALGKALSGNLVSSAIAAGVAFFSLGAILGKTKQALDEFGDIADKSAQSGLDPEFFQEISYGAGLAGVSMDELSSSLNTFSKNAGLAVVGKGKMVQALQKLNPALLESIRNAKSQEERVRLAADAIDAAKSASEKAAIATTLFGNAGGKLVPVFDGGAAAIDRMAARAQALGIVVDRDLIARADELGDQIETATKIIDIQFSQALVNLAPVLIRTADLAADVADRIRRIVDYMSDLENKSTRGLQEQLSQISSDRLDIENKILEAQSAQRQEAEKLSATANSLGFADSKNPALPGGDIDALKAQSAELKKQEQSIENILTLRNQAAADAKAAAANKSDTTDTVLPPITPAGSSSRDKAAEEAKRQAQAVADLIGNLEYELSLVGKTELEQAKMNALRQAGASATEEQKQKILDLVTATNAAKVANEAMMQSVQLQRDMLSGAMTDVRTALEDGKITTQEWRDVFLNAIGKVADALQTQIVNALITPANGGFNIFSALFGGGVAATGGSAGAGGAASATSASASMPASRMPSVRPARNPARGGQMDVNVRVINDGLNIRHDVEVVADERVARRAPRIAEESIRIYRHKVMPGDVKKIMSKPRDTKGPR